MAIISLFVKNNGDKKEDQWFPYQPILCASRFPQTFVDAFIHSIPCHNFVRRQVNQKLLRSSTVVKRGIQFCRHRNFKFLSNSDSILKSSVLATHTSAPHLRVDAPS